MKTFAIYNLKGGVGKTTSCVNLAYLAAKEGHHTLVWDIDPQGASTYILRQQRTSKIDKLLKLLSDKEEVVENVLETDYENLFVIPSNDNAGRLELLLTDLKKSKKRLKKSVGTLKGSFDYIFIDCPPNLNLLAENIFHTADFILVPIIPSTLSENAYDQVYAFLEKNGYDTRKLIPFFTLVDKRKKIHQQTIERFEATKRKILRSIIPYSSALERMSEEKAPIQQFSPNSVASSAYKNLWQELKWFKKFKMISIEHKKALPN